MDRSKWRVVRKGDRIQQSVTKRKAVGGVEREVSSGYAGQAAPSDGVYIPGACIFISLDDLRDMEHAVEGEQIAEDEAPGGSS